MDDDTRAETALRRALAREADAYEPVDLVPRTDVRRRRWLLPVAAAAASVLVVGGGLVATGALGGDDDGVAATAGGGATRTVSWRDVAVEVPASWQEGAEPRQDWCAAGAGAGTSGPYVARESTSAVVLSILCPEPTDGRPAAFGPAPQEQWAPHVTFADAAAPEALPDGEDTFDGWTVAVRTLGEVQLRVWSDASTTDEAAAVLASARTITTDANGCDVRSPAQAQEPVRPPDAFDVAEVEAVDAIAVCQYDRHRGDGAGLAASRQVAGAEAAALLEGIRSAPVGGGPDRPQECLQTMSGDSSLVVRLLRGDRVDDLYVYYDWCSGNGYDDGTTRRALTAANCAPLFGGPVRAFSYSSFLSGTCD